MATKKRSRGTTSLEERQVELTINEMHSVNSVTKKQNISGRAKSDEILNNRVVSNTQQQYQTTFNFISNYCGEKYPESINEDGELIIPMKMEHIEAFLGDMSADRDDGSCKAKSTLTGYCTVIKYYYKKKHVPINEELKDYFKGFHEGVKRLVAKKKI